MWIIGEIVLARRRRLRSICQRQGYLFRPSDWYSDIRPVVIRRII